MVWKWTDNSGKDEGKDKGGFAFNRPDPSRASGGSHDRGGFAFNRPDPAKASASGGGEDKGGFAFNRPDPGKAAAEETERIIREHARLGSASDADDWDPTKYTVRNRASAAAARRSLTPEERDRKADETMTKRRPGYRNPTVARRRDELEAQGGYATPERQVSNADRKLEAYYTTHGQPGRLAGESTTQYERRTGPNPTWGGDSVTPRVKRMIAEGTIPDVVQPTKGPIGTWRRNRQIRREERGE